ncbi:Hypothetical predicted protein [Olea europaea subsp. europaea]|uniref:Disease resistance N-terminal domain-containing protein n=1 Tax=Olea europaea subsp. europaea TaxID=158383 RepID=A0A8S0RMN7_OLEEU|nr:Hypothetical predicted protein [Olea europaea subsp. europaea]
MEAVAIEGVKFILEKLFAVAAGEINLVRGFKNELANLKKYLVKVNQVLEDAARYENDKGVISWLKDLEDAAYDADIVLDEIKYEDLRRTIEMPDEIKPMRCLNIFCCTNTTLTFQREMAHKIKDINANFKRDYKLHC